MTRLLLGVHPLYLPSKPDMLVGVKAKYMIINDVKKITGGYTVNLYTLSNDFIHFSHTEFRVPCYGATRTRWPV